MTRKEAFEKFLSSNGSKLYLKCSVAMTIYKAVCLTVILVMLLALLRFSGESIFFCITVAAALLSCWLLFKSGRNLISRISGKETNLLKTIQTIHLGVGIQLLYTPFMCMMFCILMSLADIGTKKINISYDYQTFRTAWEIFGLISFACAIFKLMSCRSIEAHIVKDAGNFLPFFLLELFYIIESGVLIYILCAFPTAQPAGIVMRVLFIPIILYHLVSAGFFISYIKFAKENGLVAEAIQRRKEAKKKRNDQQQK